jgi:RimJ/RimL family protein N-acetyltransferase
VIGRNLKLLISVFRTGGLREVLHRLAFRFRGVHTFDVYRLRLSDSLQAGQAPPEVHIKEVTRDQLRVLRQGRSDLHEYFYRDEIETLDRIWVGLKDGRLGFICWVSYKGLDLVRCGENEAEVSYFYCLEELRGRRLTTNVLLTLARTLFDEGYRSLLVVPDSDNPPIVKSLVGCGFVKVGSIRRFGLFHWPPIPVDYGRARPR